MHKHRRLLAACRRKTFPQAKKKGEVGKAPRKVAVDNLSLAIDGKGCFALLGPNGAGKTTTLSMLTGDISPTAGEAWIEGFSVRTQLMQIFRMLGCAPVASCGPHLGC